MAREQHPDIIVLDVIMPEMDGWQVMEKLRELPETADIPIIMQSMLSERELALALGADDYLTKPVDKSGLPSAVRKLLPDLNLDLDVVSVRGGRERNNLEEGVAAAAALAIVLAPKDTEQRKEKRISKPTGLHGAS